MTYYSIDVEKTQAAGTHLTNAQVDNYLKVEFDVTAENTLIDNMTKAAEEQAEEFCNLCINEHDVTLRITDVDTDNGTDYVQFNLPYRGTISSLVVNSVYQGTNTLIASTGYYIKGKNTLVILDLNSVDTDYLITYTVTPSNLPIGLDVAIYKLIGDFYTNRTNEGIAQVFRISEGTRAVLSPFQDVKSWI